MTGNDNLLEMCRTLYPDIRRCCGAGWVKGEATPAWAIVERAIQFECCKVQLFKPFSNQAMIDKAHEHGIRCNMFYADDPEEAQRYLDMGIDCILTNDYLTVANAVKYWK